MGTPFILLGEATDPNVGDTLTYSWEQYNASTNPSSVNVDNGDNAIIRAFPPVATKDRYVPSLSALYSGGVFAGEVLPSKARTSAAPMKMILVVRDQKSGVDVDDMSIVVDAASGPFKITSHTAAVQMNTGSEQTVKWDVANTQAAPVSCGAVSVELVTGDPSYGDTITRVKLASGVNNDGEQKVTIPANTPTTSKARFAVVCDTNIFGALSAVNLGVNQVPPTLPARTFTTQDTQVLEGDFDGQTQMRFKVTMSRAMTTNQQVSYTIRHIDTDNDDFFTPTGAIPGGVYVFPSSGVLTFQPGQTVAYAVLNVIGDKVDTSNETFKFQLYDGSTRVADVIGTILDDDTPARIASISPATVTEVDAGANSNAVFTVSSNQSMTRL